MEGDFSERPSRLVSHFCSQPISFLSCFFHPRFIHDRVHITGSKTFYPWCRDSRNTAGWMHLTNGFPRSWSGLGEASVHAFQDENKPPSPSHHFDPPPRHAFGILPPINRSDAFFGGQAKRLATPTNLPPTAKSIGVASAALASSPRSHSIIRIWC